MLRQHSSKFVCCCLPVRELAWGLSRRHQTWNTHALWSLLHTCMPCMHLFTFQW